jgi:hypothetical protein
MAGSTDLHPPISSAVARSTWQQRCRRRVRFSPANRELCQMRVQCECETSSPMRGRGGGALAGARLNSGRHRAPGAQGRSVCRFARSAGLERRLAQCRGREWSCARRTPRRQAEAGLCQVIGQYGARSQRDVIGLELASQVMQSQRTGRLHCRLRISMTWRCRRRRVIESRWRWCRHPVLWDCMSGADFYQSLKQFVWRQPSQ